MGSNKVPASTLLDPHILSLPTQHWDYDLEHIGPTGNEDTHSSIIRQALCVISRCHLGNTDFVRVDHTNRGINTVPSVRHGIALRQRKDAPTQEVTFDEVVHSLLPTHDLR